MGMFTSCMSKEKDDTGFANDIFKASNPQTNEICEVPSSKIDADDLSFIEQKNKTLIKKQGSIQMNSFLIDECENCQIFILDTTAQITIDYCKDCNIFLSPCEGSVFIRNCENCNIVSVCSQMRLRECVNLEIMLFCASNPCIETSTNINFYCHQFAYFSLLQQMEAAKLCFFDNLWFNVHDFGVEDRSQFEIKHNSNGVKNTFKFLYDLSQNVHDEMQPIEQHNIPLTVGRILNVIEESYEESIIFVIGNNEDFIFDSFRKLQKEIVNDENAYFIQMKTVPKEHPVIKDKSLLVGDDEETMIISIHLCISQGIKHFIGKLSSDDCRIVAFGAADCLTLKDSLFVNHMTFNLKC